MNRPSILILTAVRMEAGAIAAALGMKVPLPGRPTCVSVGSLHVSLHLIGIRATGLVSVVLDEKPACVVMAGLAGALDPTLAVGDVVVDDCPAQFAGTLSFRRGKIHTETTIVSTPQREAQLFESTGAIAVDMETGVVRQWAREREIDFLAVRAISDSAGQELHPDMLRLVDAWGRPNAAALAGYLARRPGQVFRLLRLSSASKLASVRLGAVVREQVHHIARLTTDNHQRSAQNP